jgi:hypothetical protein
MHDGRGGPRLHELLLSPIRALGPYVTRHGYRDGLAGLFYAANAAFYAFMRTAKRWDQARIADRQPRYDRVRERLVSGFDERP